MKVCILQPAGDPPCEPGRFVETPHTFEIVSVDKASAVGRIRDLVRDRFDLFVNLCDGAWDDTRPGIEVVHALERFAVAFTGADHRGYEPSDEQAKMVADYAAVPTPAHGFASTVEESETIAQRIGFPCVIKPPGSEPSVLCLDIAAVHTHAARFLAAPSRVLIERANTGVTCAVLVVEDPDDRELPIAFPAIEIDGPEVADEALAAELAIAAQSLFLTLHGTSYAVCTFRVDRDTGEWWFLALTPNARMCSQQPTIADRVLQLPSSRGSFPTGHARFLDTIVKTAVARRVRVNAERDPVAIKRYSDGGFSLVATRSIAVHEPVLIREDRPRTLVSRNYAEARWSPTRLREFRRYAWPISEDVFATWSDDLAQWRPINHSCDPSCWFAAGGGLNIVARRPLEPGDEINIDYATFCSDAMEPFDCKCGSANCRERITKNDFLNLEILRPYGTHMTDYVRRRNSTKP